MAVLDQVFVRGEVQTPLSAQVYRLIEVVLLQIGVTAAAATRDDMACEGLIGMLTRSALHSAKKAIERS